MQMNPYGWLNVSARFISWMKLRLKPLRLQKDKTNGMALIHRI